MRHRVADSGQRQHDDTEAVMPSASCAGYYGKAKNL
jgi:hypothetical protein